MAPPSGVRQQAMPMVGIRAQSKRSAPRRVEIASLALDALTEDETIAAALAGLRSGEGGWICPANLDVLRQVVNDPKTHALVDRADLVVADGMPLIWASKVQGTPIPERVAGSSLITTLPAAAAAEGRSVYLLGGDPGVAAEASERLRASSPDLRIAGTCCPPVGFETTPAGLRAVEDAVVAAQPDIVFVALGFPKQERLIEHLRAQLPQTWWVSCGISLSFVSGAVSRAPAWMQRSGLEWAHRLIQEPRRLARRYLVEGIPFLIRVLAVSLRRRVLSLGAARPS
jgi:N-acetylglucosaminyldiphosphoundecaprenol N-acetyl-beta-D-mannosaminyltransferase